MQKAVQRSFCTREISCFLLDKHIFFGGKSAVGGKNVRMCGKRGLAPPLSGYTMPALRRSCRWMRPTSFPRPSVTVRAVIAFDSISLRA